MFVILIHYKKPLELIDQTLAAHRAFLAEGYAKNYFIASGPSHPRVGGVILSQLKDKAQLDNIIQQDPFYVQDLADYEVIEFEPVKYHPSFHVFI